MASSNEAQFNSSKDFFKNQIENLYDVENRLTNALPKMADAAGSGALRQAFQNHLSETKGHVSRLEVIFRDMKVDPRRETCQAVKGLIAQAEKAIGRTGNSAVKDAALVAAARQVERYEMTAYGKACMIARQLGLEMAGRLLQQTLNEEDAGNYELTLIARRMVSIQVIVKWASGERHVSFRGADIETAPAYRSPTQRRISMALFGGTEFNSLEDLFVNQIEDLYDAENRLTKALPKMADAASSSSLKQAFQSHLTETEGHVSRLETIFREVNVEPKRETCQAMKGLISEGEDMVGATGDPAVKDAALIAAAQRVEHYEISGYGTARTIAQQLGLTDAATLLQQTLNEEKAADQKLNTIAESSVNVRATTGGTARRTAAAGRV
jgi:ferritin-like metal-binding protein YciE